MIPHAMYIVEYRAWSSWACSTASGSSCSTASSRSASRRGAGTLRTRAVLDARRAALGQAWQIDSHRPIALDADSEPEPDVAVAVADLLP